MDLNFFIDSNGLTNLGVKKFDVESSELEKVTKYSYLGTPVYSNLEFPAGEYVNNKGETIQFDGLRIDTVLFDISINKNIVKTAINGRDGTVKQFISMSDYEINAQGIIIGESDESNGNFSVTETNRVPETEIRKLNEILQVPQEIEVISEFLDFFDISTVVFEGANIGQREGFRDSVFFSFGMLSDTPIELR